MAATYPPGPAPMTMRSNELSVSLMGRGIVGGIGKCREMRGGLGAGEDLTCDFDRALALLAGDVQVRHGADAVADAAHAHAATEQALAEFFAGRAGAADVEKEA